MITTLQSKVSNWFWAESMMMWVPRIQLIVNCMLLPVMVAGMISCYVGLFVVNMALMAGGIAVTGVTFLIMVWLDGKVSQKKLSRK